MIPKKKPSGQGGPKTKHTTDPYYRNGKNKSRKNRLTPLEKQNWIANFLWREYSQDAPCFNMAHAAIVRSTSASEAIFLHYMLYKWMARTKDTDEKLGSYIFRKDPRGFYLYATAFVSETGLSKDIFYRLVEKYEDMGIFLTEQEPGRMKYYKVNTKKLKRYIRWRMSEIGYESDPAPRWDKEGYVPHSSDEDMDDDDLDTIVGED